jgi:hypothetical protein
MVFPGAFQPTGNGNYEAFIVKMNLSTGSVQGGTFLGGDKLDIVFDIFEAPDSKLLIVGGTASSDFPVSTGSFDDTPNGETDLFFTLMDQELTTLLASTYFGAERDDHYAGAQIVSDRITFSLSSRSEELPTSQNAWRRNHFLMRDVYVGSLSLDLTTSLAGTYYGTNRWEEVTALAVTPDGHIWLSGSTESDDLPTTDLAPQPDMWKIEPCFLASFSSDLSDLVFSSYFIGSASAQPRTLARKSNGNIVFSGIVYGAFSENAPFLEPGTPGGYSDLIIGEFTSDGQSLEWLSVTGGSGEDVVYDIIVDAQDKIILGGGSKSPDFPVSAGSFDTVQRGGMDGFILKMNSEGNEILAGSFLGSVVEDVIISLAVTTDGDIISAGNTDSPLFPTTQGAFDRINNGAQDCFISIFSNDLAVMRYSTFLGGMDFDSMRSVSYSATLGIFAAGYTRSINFPTTVGSFQQFNRGGWDGFATRLEPDLSEQIYGTYIGGRDWDKCYDAVLKSDGRYCLTGATESVDFPYTENSFGPDPLGGYDSFIVELDPSGASIHFSGCLGSIDGEDYAKCIDLHGNGTITVLGSTSASFFPATPGGISESSDYASWFSCSIDDSGTCVLFSSLYGRIPFSIIQNTYWDKPAALLALDDTSFIGAGYCQSYFESGTDGSFGDHPQIIDPGFFFKVDFPLSFSNKINYQSLARGLNPVRLSLQYFGTGTDMTWFSSPACDIQNDDGTLLITNTQPGATRLTISVNDSCLGIQEEFECVILTAFHDSWFDWDTDGFNRMADLNAALPLWQTHLANDPDQSGVMNLLDYLYIRTMD